ncbi:MAG TPA: hypothetical protein PK653_04440 [Syntrophales bacterium]|nr:hypothetical protein [Syntrophales bacterium]
MFDVRELVDIYGLPEETVKAELLKSISNSLSAVFGAEIEVLSSEAGTGIRPATSRSGAFLFPASAGTR